MAASTRSAGASKYLEEAGKVLQSSKSRQRRVGGGGWRWPQRSQGKRGAGCASALDYESRF
jgi:hypothetical protein